jgi:hypothetical protein
MIEHAPRIGFGVDDVNTRRSLSTMERLRKKYGYTFQASVLVQDEPGRIPDVAPFAKKRGGRVRECFPVLHVSLFTGVFEGDPEHYFGHHGELHKVLHAREHIPLHDKNGRVLQEVEESANRLLDGHERYVIDQIHRQHDRFSRLFKIDPYGYSYHYGIHWLPRLIGLFSQAARERGLPYRYDASRAQAPRRSHVEVYDGLNVPGVTPDKFLRMLQKKSGRLGMTEVTFHFGEKYGKDQEHLFEDINVRRMLRQFTHELPSEMWRRTEYPSLG